MSTNFNQAQGFLNISVVGNDGKEYSFKTNIPLRDSSPIGHALLEKKRTHDVLAAAAYEAGAPEPIFNVNVRFKSIVLVNDSDDTNILV